MPKRPDRGAHLAALLLTTCVAACPGTAGDAPTPPEPATSSPPAPRRPVYQGLRHDEDWSAVSSLEDGGDLFDPIKRVPIAADGAVWASFGGQARLRLEGWDGFNFGADSGGAAPFAGPDDDVFLLSRFLFHGDLHLGPYVRVFAQGKSALSTDRDLLGGRRTLDVDELDLQNAFVDLTVPFLEEDVRATLRVGRQELLFGKERLVSPLDWANVRRTFDGISTPVRFEGWRLTPFWTRPVVVQKYDFNDLGDDQDFGGVYASGKIPSTDVGLDLYWLFLDKDAITFNGLTDVATGFNGTNGPEERHTLGGRLASKVPGTSFDGEVEGAYQLGEVGPGDIHAFLLTAVAGYTAEKAPWTPRLFVGADYASGDEAAGGDVETFNQLFPLGHAFLGWIDQIGRQNIIDVYPGMTLKPLKILTIDLHGHLFWRARDTDGAYNASGVRVRAPGIGLSREVGQEIDLLAKLQLDRHTLVSLGYSHFFAGDFIEQSGPSEDIDFAYLILQYTF